MEIEKSELRPISELNVDVNIYKDNSNMGYSLSIEHRIDKNEKEIIFTVSPFLQADVENVSVGKFQTERDYYIPLDWKDEEIIKGAYDCIIDATNEFNESLRKSKGHNLKMMRFKIDEFEVLKPIITRDFMRFLKGN